MVSASSSFQILDGESLPARSNDEVEAPSSAVRKRSKRKDHLARRIEFYTKMQNEEGTLADLYILRKCSATNHIIMAKDHTSVQINGGHRDQVIIMSSGTGPCEDVIQEIIERISHHKDLLCCAAVCKKWGYIVMNNITRLPYKLPLSYCLPRQHLLPLLMHFNDDEVVGKVDFISILDNKSFTDYLPEMTGKWIVGSSNGCLVLTELFGRSKNITLLNPLTRAQISLPSFLNYKFKDFGSDNFRGELDEMVYIRKAIIMFEHNSRSLEGCTVISIISCQRTLAFCRPKDDKWTAIEGSPCRVNDMVYFRSQLYAVLSEGELVSFDVGHRHQCGTVVAGFAEDSSLLTGWWMYLVESTSGELLLVMLHPRKRAYDFEVYKLEEVDKETEIRLPFTDDNRQTVRPAVKYLWVKVKSLDDQILFIGQNISKSVPASLYPHLKGNCIYYTDEDKLYSRAIVASGKAGSAKFRSVKKKFKKYDMGIYDMEEKSTQPIGFMDDKLFPVPPVWVEPHLWLTNN